MPASRGRPRSACADSRSPRTGTRSPRRRRRDGAALGHRRAHGAGPAAPGQRAQPVRSSGTSTASRSARAATRSPRPASTGPCGSGMRTGRAVRTGGCEPVRAMYAPSPSARTGSTLASGGEDGTLVLWDTATGSRLGQRLSGHQGQVLGVAFGPDGSTLATAGRGRNRAALAGHALARRRRPGGAGLQPRRRRPHARRVEHARAGPALPIELLRLAEHVEQLRAARVAAAQHERDALAGELVAQLQRRGERRGAGRLDEVPRRSRSSCAAPPGSRRRETSTKSSRCSRRICCGSSNAVRVARPSANVSIRSSTSAALAPRAVRGRRAAPTGRRSRARPG